MGIDADGGVDTVVVREKVQTDNVY